MTTAEPAWKKFLKLKSDVPVATANIADAPPANTLKRKREALPPQNPQKSILKAAAAAAPSAAEIAEKKAKANKQKKKAKTKTKRSKKDEADSKAAQGAALEYLSLYCSARNEWKFSKPRQNYLIKHTYDDDLIPEDRFASLLKYLQGLQGGSKERCLETAQGLMKRYKKQQTSQSQHGDESEETTRQEENKEDEEETEVEDVTEDQFERAKQIDAALTAAEDSDAQVEQ